MSWFDEALEAGADCVYDVHGQTVSYRPDPADPEDAVVPISALAIVEVEGLVKSPTSRGGTLGHSIVIRVRKSEVPTVKRNKDHIDVPGSWLESDAATVRCLVAEILPNRADAAVWRLGLAKQRGT